MIIWWSSYSFILIIFIILSNKEMFSLLISIYRCGEDSKWNHFPVLSKFHEPFIFNESWVRCRWAAPCSRPTSDSELPTKYKYINIIIYWLQYSAGLYLTPHVTVLWHTFYSCNILGFPLFTHISENSDNGFYLTYYKK